MPESGHGRGDGESHQAIFQRVGVLFFFLPAASCAASPSARNTCASRANTGSRNFSKRFDPPRLCGQPSHPAMIAHNGQDDQRHRHRLRRFVDVVLHLVAHARLAVESQEHQAEHVKRGHQRGGVADQPQQAVGAAFGGPGLPQDFIFGEKSGKGRDACDGKGRDEHGPVSDRECAGAGRPCCACPARRSWRGSPILRRGTAGL